MIDQCVWCGTEINLDLDDYTNLDNSEAEKLCSECGRKYTNRCIDAVIASERRLGA